MELLESLRAQLGLSILFITHDLGLVASGADRVLVLSQGSICESGAVSDVLTRPTADYTKLLLSSAPRLRVDPSEETTLTI
jgi:peptide/nickel transport system ATP-binding protein